MTSYAWYSKFIGFLMVASGTLLALWYFSVPAAAQNASVGSSDTTLATTSALSGTVSGKAALQELQRGMQKGISSITTNTVTVVGDSIAGSSSQATRVQEKIRAFQAAQSTLREQRLVARIERTQRRLSAALAREQNISDRIQSRINKLEATHIDESGAVIMLAQANQKIDAAQISIATFSTAEPTMTTGDPKIALANIQKLGEDATAALRSALDALMVAVDTIRTAPATNPAGATSANGHATTTTH